MVLHIATKVSQVRIVEDLNKRVGLSHLVNKGVGNLPEDKPLQTGGNKDPTLEKDPLSKISEEDTPLHIATRKKSFNMSTPITTGDKLLFLYVTNLLACATFAFTTYGFMAVVYAMLANENNELAWFILGACLIICCCGNFTFFYMVSKFFVKKARFNHLNGLLTMISLRNIWPILSKKKIKRTR